MSKIRSNQDGLAAIVITTLVMIILGLLVLAFARLSQRELRQSLDRQLSTQAFYAAETGVNDALDAIDSGVISLNSEKTDCADPDGVAGTAYTDIVDSATGSAYTCLQVDPSPFFLEYTVGTDASRVVKIQSETAGQAIPRIDINWEDDQSTQTDFSTCPPSVGSLNDFPDSWPTDCKTGIIRVDIVPYATSASPSRDALITSQFTAFLVPNASPASVSPINYSTGAGLTSQGLVTAGNCASGNTPRSCRVAIHNLPTGTDRYYVRIKSIYNPNLVTIEGRPTNGVAAGNNPLELIGSQVVIDSTGKAQDVLKRIQQRVTIENGRLLPEFGIQSMDTLCKRFVLVPPNNLSIVAPATASSVCDPTVQ